MKNKWLNIEAIEGEILRIRKDRIVAISLSGIEEEKGYQWIAIYVQTHVGRTKFSIGIYCDNCCGYDYYLDEKVFYELRAYLDKATQLKGELNLDPE